MLPNLPQRLLIALALVVGGLFCLSVRPLLMPGDGMGGLTLLRAPVTWAGAALLVAVAGLPAAALGTVAAASGNKLGGVFAVGVAVGLLGVAGGPIDGWLWRTANPAGYVWLVGEMLLWAAGVIGLLMLIERGHAPVRGRLPALLRSDDRSHPSPLGWPGATGVVSCVVAAVVGGLATYALLQASNAEQVAGAMILGFAVGGLVARLANPNARAAGVLLSPCVVGIAAYAYVALNYVSEPQLLRAWYDGELLNLALALPIHYASMGVAGAALGLGMGQSLEQLHMREVAGQATVIGPTDVT